MSNKDQTFRKQRLGEGTRAEECYGNHTVPFYDLDANSILEDEGHFRNEDVIPQEVNRSDVTHAGASQKRIRELEKTVYLQNRDIQQKKIAERDLDAALNTIARKKAENVLLRESREKCYHECEFYKNQAAEKTKQCERYEERIREMNLRHMEDLYKIRELEMKVGCLTENYGHDMTEGNHGDDVTEGNYGDDVTEGNYGDDVTEGNYGDDVTEGNYGDDVTGGNYGDDVTEGNYGDDVTERKFEHPVTDGNYGPDITERNCPEECCLVRKHEEMITDSGIENESSVSLPKRQRYFRKSLTSLPKCRNCQTVFDQLRPHEITCTFHRVAPHPLKAWKSQLNLVDLDLDNMTVNSYMYWPCCEKYGLKEPPGCLKLKSHEIIYPDEE